jgi:hypothetical protein
MRPAGRAGASQGGSPRRTTILGLPPRRLFGGALRRGMTIVTMSGLGAALTLFVVPRLHRLACSERSSRRRSAPDRATA